ncbi:MAG: ABC transporter permease [Clostridia bacterium]|nr:ABC transporter permease [Clostridia bacterium]
MSARVKFVFRLFKNQLSRFFSLVIIVVVSIGFMSGIGEVETKIDVGMDEYYREKNVSDLYLKSSSPTGFSADDLSWIEETFGAENVLKGFSYEYQENEEVVRVYSYDLSTDVNRLTLLEGRLPQERGEIVVERETEELRSFSVGDTVAVMGQEYEVCGIVVNPLLLNRVEEPSFQYEDECLRYVYYLDAVVPMTNDVYVAMQDRDIFQGFSDEYEEETERLIALVEQEVSDVAVLSLYENFGLYSLSSYAGKVGMIALIFVVFFLLITLLVVYSTMTRLFDEERAQLACMKTFGYTSLQIVGRYVLFVFLASLIGGGLSFFVGHALTEIIYNAFHLQYEMPPMPSVHNYLFFAGSFAIILMSTVLLTLLSGLKAAGEKPATLLLPKLAKSGKKVFLEKIPFLWNRLSFRYKSTVRNVFLFKGRFFMTVISVIGSTVLVFAGMGLMNCAAEIDGGSSLLTISLALLVFSAALCALVVYNLTNINVGERKREIATLMVLGYDNREVSGYIYREIYIMGAIGALLGVALGYFFMDLVFYLIDFGAVSDIKWWTYLVTPIVTLFFCFLATLLLRGKIVNTDMNASLKSIE